MQIFHDVLHQFEATSRMSATSLKQTSRIHPKGVVALCVILCYPSLVVVACLANSGSVHAHPRFGCVIFGWTAWVAIEIIDMLGMLDLQFSFALIVEMVLGIIPIIYLLNGYWGSTSRGNDAACQAWITSMVPLAIITKQLLRTAMDLMAGKPSSSWKRLPINLAETLIFFTHGMMTSVDVHGTVFAVYSSTLVAFTALLFDQLILHLHVPQRYNDRLIQKAYTAIISIDGQNGGRVTDSSPEFDLLVDGPAAGLRLQSLVTASSDQLRDLCFAPMDEETVLRRLRTTIVSRTQSFQQEVELRVVARSQQDEGVITLGLLIMREREPLLDTQTMQQSILFDEHLEEVGQLRCVYSDASPAANMDSVPEYFAVCCDSISGCTRPVKKRKEKSSSKSCGGSYCRPTRVVSTSTRRERPQQNNAALAFNASRQKAAAIDRERNTLRMLTTRSHYEEYQKAHTLSYTGSDPSTDATDNKQDGLRTPTTHSARENQKQVSCDDVSLKHGTPYGDRWKAPQGAYLSECSKSLLIDLLSTWNYEGYKCCRWHAAIRRLSAMVEELSTWHACTDVWPTLVPTWQCGTCSGLQFEHTTSEECFLCGAPAASPHSSGTR